VEIKKGQIVEVRHTRKGTFTGKATRDFDTEKEEWYPIAVYHDFVKGMAMFTAWGNGDEIPCRNTQCTIIPIDKV